MKVGNGPAGSRAVNRAGHPMRTHLDVTAGTSGTVDTVHVQDTAQVEPGDPVVAMTPAPPA